MTRVEMRPTDECELHCGGLLVGCPHDPRRFTLDGQSVSVLEFIDVNDFDMPEIEQIDALAVGMSINYGGGAAPIFTLTREA